MPQVELRTRTRINGRTGPELILEIILTPKGSGNRKLALGLAQAARRDPRIGPHVKRVRAGYSKVWVTLTPSLQLARTLFEMQAAELARAGESDVPGQMPLFGGPLPA